MDVLDKVTSLVDKSLLQSLEGPDGEPRFLMLEAIREYAQECLDESGEAEVVRRQHVAYYRALVDAASVGFWNTEHGVWIAKLDAQQDNLRAALTWALERRDAEIALRLAAPLGHYWRATGRLSEGRQWTEAVIAVAQSLDGTMADPTAAKAIGSVLRSAATFTQFQNDLRPARAFAEQAVAVSRSHDDKVEVAWCVQVLANICTAQQEYALATALHDEAVALRRELGDTRLLAMFLNDSGWARYLAGDVEGALEPLEESLALHREIGVTSMAIVFTLESLGMVLLERGAFERARDMQIEALRLSQEYGDRSLQMWSLEGFAWLSAAEGATHASPVMASRRAARLFGAAEALRALYGQVFSSSERRLHDRHVAAGRRLLGEPMWLAAWAEGRDMTLEQAVAYALKDEAGNGQMS